MMTEAEVKQLLIDRDITPEILKKEERYWNEVLPKVLEENTFTYFCAERVDDANITYS